MTLVVTGAAGFLGSALVRELRAAGEPVVAVDRRRIDPQPGLIPIQADLVALDARVRDALAAADAVIHLAGCPGVRDNRPDVDARRRRDNVLATAAVLRDVPRRTPLVVASSSSVYGGSDGGPCAEDAVLRPRGGYARSKVVAESLCRHRAALGGRVTVVRPFTVAGEGQRPDMAIARWLRDARAGRPLTVFGSLDRTRDITDVRDVAGALWALVQRGAQGVVNIGTGQGRSLAALTDAVAAALDVDVRVDVVPASVVEPADTLADTTRLHRLAGFVPRTDLHDVVARQARAQGRAAEALTP